MAPHWSARAAEEPRLWTVTLLSEENCGVGKRGRAGRPVSPAEFRRWVGDRLDAGRKLADLGEQFDQARVGYCGSEALHRGKRRTRR
jgi:hypothetical protein